MKFITFTDIHISSYNPQSRVGDYQEDILEKLRQIGNVGKKVGVDFYMLAGDLFNLKYPMRNPHSLNTALIEIFKDFGAPIYTTEGNHDLRNDSYATFDEQPLKVLYSSGALIQLREQIVTKGDISVALRAFPFEEHPDFTAMTKKVDGVDLSIAMLHIYSGLKGGNYHTAKVYSYNEIAQMGDDIFVMGHMHLDQGISNIVHCEKEVTFINVGAVSRGSMSDDNATRSPKIGYVDITKADGKVSVTAKAVRLKVKPAEEVFDLDSKEDEKKKQEEAELFVEKLRLEDSSQDALGRIDSAISDLSLDKIILDSVSHYLSEADLALKVITK